MYIYMYIYIFIYICIYICIYIHIPSFTRSFCRLILFYFILFYFMQFKSFLQSMRPCFQFDSLSLSSHFKFYVTFVLFYCMGVSFFIHVGGLTRSPTRYFCCLIFNSYLFLILFCFFIILLYVFPFF